MTTNITHLEAYNDSQSCSPGQQGGGSEGQADQHTHQAGAGVLVVPEGRGEVEVIPQSPVDAHHHQEEGDQQCGGEQGVCTMILSLAILVIVFIEGPTHTNRF